MNNQVRLENGKLRFFSLSCIHIYIDKYIHLCILILPRYENPQYSSPEIFQSTDRPKQYRKTRTTRITQIDKGRAENSKNSHHSRWSVVEFTLTAYIYKTPKSKSKSS